MRVVVACREAEVGALVCTFQLAVGILGSLLRDTWCIYGSPEPPRVTKVTTTYLQLGGGESGILNMN
jgi:hypothetical protein